jgi:hypothetical protein
MLQIKSAAVSHQKYVAQVVKFWCRWSTCGPIGYLLNQHLIRPRKTKHRAPRSTCVVLSTGRVSLEARTTLTSSKERRTSRTVFPLPFAQAGGQSGYGHVHPNRLPFLRPCRRNRHVASTGLDLLTMRPPRRNQERHADTIADPHAGGTGGGACRQGAQRGPAPLSV